MIQYRLACRSGWLKTHAKTGDASSVWGKQNEAASFATEELAQEFLDKAISKVQAKFTALFPTGAAPRLSGCCLHADEMRALSSTAKKLAIFHFELSTLKVEAFQAVESLEVRMGLPPLFAILSAKGGFARQGATGWMAFVEELDDATLFSSVEQAQEYIQGCQPRGVDQDLMPTARIVELKLSLGRSLDPANLKASDNDASAMMRSLQEKDSLGGEALAAQASKKKSSSL